jgi:hypothetical protein
MELLSTQKENFLMESIFILARHFEPLLEIVMELNSLETCQVVLAIDILVTYWA